MLLRTLNVCAIALCLCIAGCAESTFELAKDSPLPAWLQLNSMPRDRITVKVSFFSTSLSGKNVEFEVYGPQGLIERKSGVFRWHASMAENPGQIPSWVVISVEDVTEVYQQRAREPFLWIVPEPEVEGADTHPKRP